MIGRGATAEVWLAWDPAAGAVPLAVKRWHPGGPGHRAPAVSPEGVARLREEALLLAQLDHPSIVEVIDVVPDPPGVALVMPYLCGGSLRGLLHERGTLGAGELVAVLAPIASALAALAEAGMIHGDVKPDNVLLTESGEPVLADVGVSRGIGAGTRSGRLACTPAYLDPASAEGGSACTRSDVFSLGVMAYEALTGRLPHRGEPAEVVALAAAGVHRPLSSWPAVGGDVAAVVESALEPDPDRRPPDAASFIARLASTVAPADVVLPGPVRDRPKGGAVERTGSHTIDFPLDPPSTTVRRSDRDLKVVVAVCTLALALAVVGVRLGVKAAQRSVARHLAGSPHLPCPSTLPGPGSGRLAWSDLDGDRCLDPVRWDGRTLVVATSSGTRSYRLGAPGDQLLLGDWDGDQRATPALYRPSVGEVHYLDRLPGRVGERRGTSRSEEVPRNGDARVVPGPPDQVQVVGS